ncbi:hypothetical protein [Alkalicoccobacillus porphyridii]|uniref:Uncharacterized protein n=1 Tax=Alkalicoccobacillus porphyridii TaxID=2597270 RepID=A0A553ZZZ2_9BACI|nr:hypothetical protein [Alkalicoccobacillus porphyridii]TSB47017.1 hypothetical protein FN960_08340 [Alkalicoccobacillus porphyridii]
MRENQHHAIEMLQRVDKALRTVEQHIHVNMQTMSAQQFIAAKRSLQNARADYEEATSYYTAGSFK